MASLFSKILAVLTLRPLTPRWRVACYATLGVLAGLAAVTGKVSRVGSYMSDRPESCVNCHVMRSAYNSWRHSSHVHTATCNDCHVPHQTLAHAYAFKARDGLYHSAIFTLRLEPQAIRLSEGAKPVVEHNCRRCHEYTLSLIDSYPCSNSDRLCWDCHREVPHGQVRSLSSTPNENVPELPPAPEPQRPTIGGREPE